MRIVRDDVTDPRVLALLELHLRKAHANSPPGSVFALDVGGLRDPAVTMWSGWDGDTLMALGALKALGGGAGEVKSMRTAPGHERRGAGRAMLGHIVAAARAEGMTRLSLETGSNAAFAPGRAMYEAAGFTPCGPFADYTDESFSRYYTLAL